MSLGKVTLVPPTVSFFTLWPWGSSNCFIHRSALALTPPGAASAEMREVDFAVLAVFAGNGKLGLAPFCWRKEEMISNPPGALNE